MRKSSAQRGYELILTIGACLWGGAAGSAESTTIDTIIVTAQKHAQSIVDVPMAMTAFGGEQLQALRVEESTGLGAFTAGLSTSMASASSAPVYSIRGVALDDVFANNSGGVQVYFDEVAPVSSAMQAFQLFDIERVEVLKGPQGTLYGRNATGGAISFFSRAPTSAPEVRINADFDSLNVLKSTLAVSGPLSSTLRGRVAVNALYSTDDGWQQGVNGSADAAAPRVWAIRGSLEADLGSDATARLTLHGGQDKSINSSWQAADSLGLGGLLFGIQIASPDQPDRIDLGRFFAAVDGTRRPRNDTSNFGATAKVDVKLALGTLTSITAYDSLSKLAYENYDGSPAAINDLRFRDHIHQVSQELRLAGEHSNLTYVAGAFVSHDVIRTDDDTLSTDVFNLAYGLDLFGIGTGPADTPEANGIQVEALTRSEQTTNAFGLFGHTEYRLSKNMRVTLAGRFSKEDRSFEGNVTDPSGFTTGVPGILVQFDRSSRSKRNGSGRLGLDYYCTDSLLFYGSISSGFKSGVFFSGPVNSVSGWGFAEPEKLVAYEGGFKTTFSRMSGQLTGTVFMYDYDDKQLLGTIQTPTGPLATLGNVPKSRIYGSELELQLRPVEGLDLRAGVSYLHTEVTEAPTSIRGAPFSSPLGKGAVLSYAPKMSYFALARYAHSLTEAMTGSAQLTYSHRDSMVTLLGDPFGVVGDSKQLGARVALQGRDERWNVALFVDNLTDQRYRTYAYTNFLGSQSYALGKPRAVGVSLAFKF